MTTRILAISDIHGCFQEFQELLKLVNFDSSKDQLILLGDYMDRGNYSKETIYFVKDLVEEQGVVALKGNHDKLFVDWLHDPVGGMDRYARNGGLETIQSFLGDIDTDSVNEEVWQDWAAIILEENKGIVDFMENLPLYVEEAGYIFVHAGINPEFADWKDTSERDFIWIREPFLDVDHHLEKTVVHGHTPTTNLHGKADIYYGSNKIGIDGACVYGGQLNCLEIVDGKCSDYFVVGKGSGVGLGKR